MRIVIKSLSLTLVLFVSFCQTLHARPPFQSALAPVPGGQFRAQFQSGIIKGFCHETKFTSHCYDMTIMQCEANMKASLEACLHRSPASLTIPAEVPPDEILGLGKKLGRCVGADFETRNRSRLRKVHECQSAKAWLAQ